MTTITALAAVAIGIFAYDARSFRRRMVEDTTVLAKMLEVSCAQAVVFSDQESATEALNVLQAQSQVVAAAIYGKDGSVFAKYTRTGTTAWTPPPQEPSGHRFEKDHLSLFRKMEFGRKRVGTVHLLVDMTALAARKVDYGKILAIDVCGAFLLAFLLSSRLQRLVSGPILYLVGVERTVSEKKDYSIRAVKQSSDEIGLLIDGFNEMLVEVEKRDAFLLEKGEQLREKNEQIMDSIRYAQHIQAAILPLPEYLTAALPEHFVIFKPCHIVSGDFYWCHRQAGKIVLAVVDCTGHGVPGAFMSMIGGSLLRSIVVDRGMTDPATILENLNIGVRTTLQQGSEGLGAQDGMDACLCVFDEATGSVLFAGAKRPLFLVSVKADAESELIEVKGDRSSVGGRQREQQRLFTSKPMPAQVGDMLYLTTDGYADQNGTSGKRLGSERMNTLLRSIVRMPLPEQRQVLLSALDEHQGNERQRDDITIVGVRVLPTEGRA